MKKAIVSVRGGVADIQENKHGLNIEIVDFDNGDKEIQVDEFKNYDAIVAVEGGVAEVVYEVENVHVEIIDYDHFE